MSCSLITQTYLSSDSVFFQLSELKPDTFRRELVLMSRENFTYLGIEEGPKAVLFWHGQRKPSKLIVIC